MKRKIFAQVRPSGPPIFPIREESSLVTAAHKSLRNYLKEHDVRIGKSAYRSVETFEKSAGITHVNRASQAELWLPITVVQKSRESGQMVHELAKDGCVVVDKRRAPGKRSLVSSRKIGGSTGTMVSAYVILLKNLDGTKSPLGVSVSTLFKVTPAVIGVSGRSWSLRE